MLLVVAAGLRFSKILSSLFVQGIDLQPQDPYGKVSCVCRNLSATIEHLCKLAFSVLTTDHPVTPSSALRTRSPSPAPPPPHTLTSSHSLLLMQCDPFLKVKIGEKEINDKDNYIPRQLNPIFGKMFELPAVLPLDHTLTISVMDWDSFFMDWDPFLAHDLIGETTIDLENRFLSQHRATCGLPESFSKSVAKV